MLCAAEHTSWIFVSLTQLNKQVLPPETECTLQARNACISYRAAGGNLVHSLPSKHAGSDPEAFWLRPVMAVTASVRTQNRPGSDMPDSTSHIHSVPFFQRRLGSYCAIRKTDQDPIWMAWSGFGLTHLVWKQASVQEPSGSVSGRTQPARYQFPTFNSVPFFHRRLG